MDKSEHDMYHETLYETTKKLQKRYKTIGWICVVAMIALSAVVSAILGPEGEISENIFAMILGIVAIATLIVGIVFLVKASRRKKEIKEICPNCHNDYRVKIDESVSSQKGYLNATMGWDERSARIDKVVTEETFDVTYQCPSCGHCWHASETENYEVYTPFK